VGRLGRGVAEGVGMERRGALHRSPLFRGGGRRGGGGGGGGDGGGDGVFAGEGVRALVARGEGTGVRGDDDRGAVVDRGRVGEVRLAEAGGGREAHAGAQDG